jgi:hypothetical protein
VFVWLVQLLQFLYPARKLAHRQSMWGGHILNAVRVNCPRVFLVTALLQIELHPLLAQRKLVGVSYRKGVVSVAHSCLVRQAPEIQESPLVQQVAAETGKTINQVSVLTFLFLLLSGFQRYRCGAIE